MIYRAKVFIIAGVFLTSIGVILLLCNKEGVGFLGRLPGDFVIKKKNFMFYFPLATSLLLSLIITGILYVFFRK